MSVRNCYVEEKIADSGSSTDITALTLEVDQNTADIAKLINYYNLLKADLTDNEKQTSINTTQIQTNTTRIAAVGTIYNYPVSSWNTTEQYQTTNRGGKWFSVFENIDLGLYSAGNYTLDVSFFALLDTVTTLSSVGVQLFQSGQSLATAYTSTSIISTSSIEPGNSLLVPCNISFPLTMDDPSSPLSLQLYFNCDSSTDFTITSTIPASQGVSSYWTESMNNKPVSFFFWPPERERDLDSKVSKQTS
jgi:hypothetical protein